MVTIILSTGSNLGDRKAVLAAASQRIALLIGPVLSVSGLYETAAWGLRDQPAFLNQALKVETLLSPEAVLEKIAGVEGQLGRTRDQKWGPRIIDIDLLYYGSAIIREENLVVPHPEIPRRRFVLEPLMEIAPDWIHPGLNLSTRELLELTPDKLPVHRLEA
jgi:2-amino-4-hydroxy-6-hydroxymethyldihydropteridine diphosphokinase